MLVRAKIIDVETRTHKDKLVADVTLKFNHPAEAVVCTLWNNSVSKDEHKPFAAFAGQEVFMAIKPEIFNGNQKYQILTSVLPQIIKAPVPVSKAS
jgi:hypothetical protein